MAIYDCFIFFNELELLEIRLAELYDTVDYFVLVEAKKTFGGDKKELFYEKNKARFKQWQDKIIHVVAELPDLNALDKTLIALSKVGPLYKITGKITIFGFGRWKVEHSLRNQIANGFPNAKPDDLIMVSDVDEIPKASAVKKAARLAKQGHVVCFRQPMYIYYLNGLSDQPWAGTKMCTYEYLRKHLKGSPQYMRTPLWQMARAQYFGRPLKLKYLDDAGWHFSYMGGTQRVIAKKKTGSHAEIAKGKDIATAQVAKDIEEGIWRYKDRVYHVTYKKIDENLPHWVLSNQKKFSHLLRPVK